MAEVIPQVLNNPITVYVQQIQIARKLGLKIPGEKTSAKKTPLGLLSPPKPKIERGLKRFRRQFRGRSSSDPALGELQADHEFLVDLVRETGLAEVSAAANDALKYLDQRRTFWEQENPELLRKSSQPGISKPRVQKRSKKLH